MNPWVNTVLTDKGTALLAKLTQGNSLHITRAVTGIGFVTPGLLTKQTEVTNPKQELTFNTVTYPESGKCAIPVSLKNDALEAGYEATQVGLYATDPDDGEILLIISQAPDANSGTIVPSATEMPGYSAEWTFYLQYGQADGVNVTVDPTNTVSREEMEARLAGKAPTQFVMTLIRDSETGEYSIDKTFAELQAAYEAGSHIRLVNRNGMEFALLAFGANYMAYFAHQLDSTRYLVGFKANGTVTYTTDVPFTENNPPYAAQVGAKGSNDVVRTSGSIKDWALAQTTSFSVGANTKVTDLPETGANWFVDLIVTSNGLWRKLVATKTNSNGSAPTTYECTCMSGTWSEWTKVYNDANKPSPADLGAAPSSHNQAASTITAGTLAGAVKANAEAAAVVSYAQVRDISAGTGDMEAGSTPLATGSLYFVYE